MFSLIFGVMTCYLVAASKPNPIAYFKFDEGTGEAVIDSSGKNKNGKIFGLNKSVRWVPGKFGHALNFNATEGKKALRMGYVSVKNMPTKFPNGLTICAWIKLNKDCNKNKFRGVAFHEIISNSKTSLGPGFRFTLFYKALLLRSGDGKKHINASSNREVTDLPNEKWLWVVTTYEPSKKQVAVFLNGMRVGVRTGDFILTEGLSTWTIGAFYFGYVPLNGAIDEIKIYDYPLSASTILKEYNNNR
jgi:hypothetical protein